MPDYMSNSAADSIALRAILVRLASEPLGDDDWDRALTSLHVFASTRSAMELMAFLATILSSMHETNDGAMLQKIVKFFVQGVNAAKDHNEILREAIRDQMRGRK